MPALLTVGLYTPQHEITAPGKNHLDRRDAPPGWQRDPKAGNEAKSALEQQQTTQSDGQSRIYMTRTSSPSIG